MARNICITLLALLLVPIILPLQQADARGHEQVYDTCKEYKFDKAKAHFKGNTTFEFDRCVDLPMSKQFIHWTYNPSNSIVKIAFRHSDISHKRWVAVAHNPTALGMIGSQVLVAHYKADGSMKAYTSPITSYTTMLAKGPLSFNVSGFSTMGFDNEIVIFATLSLPNSDTVLNLVWQDGPLSKKGKPVRHETIGPNIRSAALLYLQASPYVNPLVPLANSLRPSEKSVHGMLCGVAWGIMMPIGASIARHGKRSSKLWFYLHVGCQIIAYIIGMAGWALGTKLGYDSQHLMNQPHRHIGNIVYAFATLQVCAYLYRPEKDHKYIRHWKRYHQFVGLTVLALSFLNIYIGIRIITSGHKWLKVYYGLVVVYIIINILVEFLKKKSNDEDDRGKTRRGYTNVPI